MSQTRWQSVLEAKANLLTAFFISWVLQVYVVPPLFGIAVSGAQGFGIVALFTAVSFVRQYIIRRLFNRHEERNHGST